MQQHGCASARTKHVPCSSDMCIAEKAFDCLRAANECLSSLAQRLLGSIQGGLDCQRWPDLPCRQPVAQPCQACAGRHYMQSYAQLCNIRVQTGGSSIIVKRLVPGWYTREVLSTREPQQRAIAPLRSHIEVCRPSCHLLLGIAD